jgi:hypothetical protein
MQKKLYAFGDSFYVVAMSQEDAIGFFRTANQEMGVDEFTIKEWLENEDIHTLSLEQDFTYHTDGDPSYQNDGDVTKTVKDWLKEWEIGFPLWSNY